VGNLKISVTRNFVDFFISRWTYHEEKDLTVKMETTDPLERLSAGIFLEDAGVLLPWGSTREELISAQTPDSIRKTPVWDVLSWRSPLLLGGIAGDELEISLAPADRFEEAWVWLKRGENEQAARQVFQSATRQLNRLFHQAERPDRSLEAGGDEIETWENGEVEISLYLRTGLTFTDFSDCCHLSLQSKLTAQSRPQADPDALSASPNRNAGQT
jgi:hypothetical protein